MSPLLLSLQELQVDEAEDLAEAQGGVATDPIWWLWLVVAIAVTFLAIRGLLHYRAGGRARR